MNLLSYRPPESAVANDSIYKSALDFIDKNPLAWEMFEKFTFQMIRSGRRRCSSKLIFERIRWQTILTQKEREEFKINNNYSSIFARLFAEKYPKHADFFMTRSRPSEHKGGAFSVFVNRRDDFNHKNNLIHEESGESYE